MQSHFRHYSKKAGTTVTVPSRLSKEPPVSDWSREQRKLERRRNRRAFFREYLSAFLGLSSILLMTILVFWQNWNLWLIPVGIAAISGIVIASHMRDGLGESLGFTLNIVCVLMIVGYGMANLDFSESDSAITVQACSMTRTGPDGYPLLVTSKGTYTITEGEYSGVDQPSAEGAASMLIPGHTYRLEINSGTHTYADITGSKEVTNTGQRCKRS